MAVEKRKGPLFVVTLMVIALLLFLVEKKEFGSYLSTACTSDTLEAKNIANMSIRGSRSADGESSDVVKELTQNLETAESTIASLKGELEDFSKKNEGKEANIQPKLPANDDLVKEINRLKAELSSSASKLATKVSDGLVNATSAAGPVNSATGTLFRGERIRTYLGERHFQAEGWEATIKVDEKRGDGQQRSCDKWGVVTTIYDPSEAIARVAALQGWCLVIVADTITRTDYIEKAGLEAKTETVYFFSVEEQQRWIKADDKVGEFTRAIPFKHFARKNLGYLYAIRNGGKFIFDFDDDNIILNDKSTGEILPILTNEHQVENVRVVSLGPSVFNPYPLMQTSIAQSWPRGFPLESIQDTTTQGTVLYNKTISMNKVGVIQFCADSNPDVDAIHRLVKPLPMTFNPDTMPLIVPSHAYVPYNAQATIHTAPALWATLLPSTVPGRVSDIWRSYFAECLFPELNLGVVFAPPQVEQIRNVHNNLADMKAESDLYFKTSKLVEFLREWKANTVSVPGRMEQLWIDLFERGYIEENDVTAVRLWLGALVQSGYEFPSLTRKRHDNVAVMGQFNYPLPVADVVYWVQKWREVFSNVLVRGKFNDTLLAEIQSHDIEVYETTIYEATKQQGFYAPMDNLQKTLQQYKNVERIEGVLYIHDDGLLNLAVITNNSLSFPTHEIIGNGWGKQEISLIDPSFSDPKSWSNSFASKYSYKIHQNGTFSNLMGEHFEAADELVSTLKPVWGMHKRAECIPGLMNLTTDPRSEPYREDDGSLLINGYAQADFLYVPKRVADEFSTVAKLFAESKVYLECSAAPIVNIVRRLVNGKDSNPVPLRIVKLCTGWGGKRGKIDLAKMCVIRGDIGVVHPVKMGKGLRDWGEAFDVVTYTRA